MLPWKENIRGRHAIPLGPLCATIPIAFNPLLGSHNPSLPTSVGGMIQSFLWTLLTIRRGLSSSVPGVTAVLVALGIARVLATILGSLPRTWVAESLKTALPPSHLPLTLPLSLPEVKEATSTILHRVGWLGTPLMGSALNLTPRPHGCRQLPSSQLQVKIATQLQIKPTIAHQASSRLVYVQRALTLSAMPQDDANRSKGLNSALAALWKIPWLNSHKETLWRLAVNGISGRHLLHPCPCGEHVPSSHPSSSRSLAWRDHHFWSCPVAQAVVEEINKALPTAWGVTIKCHHLWLLSSPHPLLHKGVWSIVAASALAAIDSGRRRLIKIHLQQASGTHQTLITDFFTPVNSVPLDAPPTQASPLERSQRYSSARFWCLLQDFSDLHRQQIPHAWFPFHLLAGDHPFLYSMDAASLIFRPP